MRRSGWIAASALALIAAPVAARSDPAAQRAAVDAQFAKAWPGLEALYRDIHQHPELAFQEQRTAGVLAARLRELGFEVSEGVGKTGVVGVLRNGPGPVVLLRTELDGLPMEEKTGLPYASRAQQESGGKLGFVAHSCGHDVHMAWWIGAAGALAAMKGQWHGTLVMVAQPAEEVVSGAKAMLADGLYTKFPRPDYAFAAHVGPDTAGKVTIKEGYATSASDAVKIVFHGQGAHGSMPDKSIDPVVMGARFVTDVQSVVSRQKDPMKFGVITVGAFHAGTVGNIIPDEAELLLTVRSYDPQVRAQLLEGIDVTAKASALMAKAPPPEVVHRYGTSSVSNEAGLSARSAQVLTRALGQPRVVLIPASEPGWTASEDYSEFAEGGKVHSVYFSIGGTLPAVEAKYKAEGKPVPVNHSPFFAPDPEISIRTGMETLVLAALMVAGK
ncbi:amidohydrolase [Novosphingobium flavum]|uniref:Amidohydrolase n=1 Tax=Novosphingobium flavum TaxID=1778672 RepID=A0A7X1FRG8_9SPHN|nr:amidohydrolase [Novosphingobium flavum]MBC2665177.1 amidohydrolase [Novosphingobium flavum]